MSFTVHFKKFSIVLFNWPDFGTIFFCRIIKKRQVSNDVVGWSKRGSNDRTYLCMPVITCTMHVRMDRRKGRCEFSVDFLTPSLATHVGFIRRDFVEGFMFITFHRHIDLHPKSVSLNDCRIPSQRGMRKQNHKLQQTVMNFPKTQTTLFSSKLYYLRKPVTFYDRFKKFTNETTRCSQINTKPH